MFLGRAERRIFASDGRLIVRRVRARIAPFGFSFLHVFAVSNRGPCSQLKPDHGWGSASQPRSCPNVTDDGDANVAERGLHVPSLQGSSCKPRSAGAP